MTRISLSGRLCVTLTMILILALDARAQFFSRGEDPGGLKWEQIRTGHFRVIFPEDFGQEARRVTHILEKYYEPNAAFLKHRPRTIPVVLHNRSVLSNGFVAWAPRRMELVTTPSAQEFSQDHLENLVLHEFRHVVQVDKLNQGVTRGFSFVLGEAGTAGVAGMMPFWFLEGDAVDAETRLSLAGRGRQASFEMEIKAILADVPGLYPYEKAVFGSYRDFVPDHYRYGYQMVAYGRNKYGNELWDNVVTFTARKPWSLYPCYFGLKKNAGLSKKGFYRETFETLRNHWKEQASGRQVRETVAINRKSRRFYTSYKFPRFINDSLVFAEKSGIDQIPEFVEIDRAGHEKRIHQPGFYQPANISVEGDIVVWTELMWDPRWERRNYSVIKVLDRKAGVERNLGLRTRYFAPDLSPDGRFIAAIEADEQNRYFLLILRTSDGEILNRVGIPGNEYPQYPAWNGKRNSIYLSSLGEGGKKIKAYNLETGQWSTLFNAGFEDIAELDSRGDYLVFRGGFAGIDNIYAINLENSKCQRVTTSSLGAFTPSLSANGDALLYADYTSQGYDIVRIPFPPGEFIPLADPKEKKEQLNVPSEKDESRVISPGRPTETYESARYRKFMNLFRFHSWAPFYVDLQDPRIEDLFVSPGLMLMSQNLLSTATTVIGYEYNLQEKDHYFHASFTYKGWYPVIKFSADYGGLPLVASPPDSSLALSTVHTDLRSSTEFSLPLNLTYNRFVMGARPSVEASYSRAYFYYSGRDAYKSGLTFLDYRLYFYDYLKQSRRDILPRLGLTFDMRYVDTPFEKEQLGSQIYGAATVYLPGFLRHQTLRVYAGSQKQEPENYLMGNLMSMPRGIHPYVAARLQKLSFDYVFPVAYPDWRVWGAAYFKRFRGRIFYDYAVGKKVYMNPGNGPVDHNFESMGIELTTDVHLAQIFLPMNIGGRMIWIPETGKTAGEFVFSVDLDRLQ